MKWLKGILIFTVVITVLYFAFVSLIVFEGDIANYQNRIEFDSGVWKNWEESEATMFLRWDMRHSLLDKHKLVGMSVSEVFELLGEPSRRSSSEMSYYLGMARSGIETGSLNLTLENGIVTDYRIWQG
ncbi:hypothetical protein [Ekhidna sp.]|uniref:hypothetical protein n=1 Tax=Ekhidna sp. TaxID=2608089 RepID=UPI0032991711